MKNDSVFYGQREDDGRPPLYEALQTLYALTGSADCAAELVKAADEVEAANPELVLAAMPPWII